MLSHTNKAAVKSLAAFLKPKVRMESLQNIHQ